MSTQVRTDAASSPEGVVATVAGSWAQEFLRVSYDDLDAHAIETAKRALLDFVGVAVAGSRLPVGQIVTRYYASLGGRPEATILATGEVLPGINAATVNGVHGHALDMDDGHRRAAGHPAAAVMAAAIAASEMYDRPGRELLRAIIVGYEVFVRVASLINPAHLRRGFHTTATVGPMAAAAAAATLRPRMDEEIFTRAIGLAGVQGAGLLEVLRDGAMAKPFQTGRGSAAGLLAVELAASGLEGPRTILEGKDGFLAAMADPVDASRLRSATDGWAISGIYFKTHAACRHTHPAIDGILQLRDQGLRPDAVRSITVRTYSVAIGMCGSSDVPAGAAEAKFSIPFTIALALMRGHAGQSAFVDDIVRDEELRALAARVTVLLDPELDAVYPGRRGARIQVGLADGGELAVEVPLARGEPESPLDRADVSVKFRENVRGSLDAERAERIEACIYDLERQPSISALWRDR
jgi:2-methylcitrate dehydratase PrpD